MLELTNEVVFHFMMIFARLGTAFANFPVISSSFMFNRARLTLALSASLVMQPMLTPYLPKYSESTADNVTFLAIEILIGLIISVAAKIYFNTLHFVGQILSMQSGLGMATFYDPTQRAQIAIFSNFMVLVATVFILASDTHHLYFVAISDSYEKFPPGELLNAGDMSDFVSHVLNESFILAFKIASPFLVVSLAVMTGSGLLARLMPNLQIFFVITPAQIIIVMSTMYIVINAIVMKITETITMSINVSGF